MNETKQVPITEDEAFDNKINFLGRWTSILAILAMLMVPCVVTLVFEIQVNLSQAIPIAIGLISMFAPMAIVENISYYPIIGAGGVYFSCITGNIMNMKLPCALSGRSIAGVEPGSRKGDIISILAVAVSSLVTTAILFISMLAIGQFLAPVLSNPILQPGFANILPALMGAVAVPFVIRSPRLSVFPIILCLVMYLCPIGKTVFFSPYYQSYTMLGVMLLSVAAAYFMHKQGLLK